MDAGVGRSAMTEEDNTDEVAQRSGNASPINRRSVIKSLGVAGGAGVFSKTVSAKGESSSQTRYDKQMNLESAVRTHSKELLMLLSKKGLLENASISEFPIEREQRISFSETATNEEGTNIVAPRASCALSEIEIRSNKHIDDGILTLVVQPESQRSYAIYSPNDGDVLQVYSKEMRESEYNTDNSDMIKVALDQNTADTVKEDVYTPNASTCCDSLCKPAPRTYIRVTTICAFGQCFTNRSCSCGNPVACCA